MPLAYVNSAPEGGYVPNVTASYLRGLERFPTSEMCMVGHEYFITCAKTPTRCAGCGGMIEPGEVRFTHTRTAEEDIGLVEYAPESFHLSCAPGGDLWEAREQTKDLPEELKGPVRKLCSDAISGRSFDEWEEEDEEMEESEESKGPEPPKGKVREVPKIILTFRAKEAFRKGEPGQVPDDVSSKWRSLPY